MVDIKHSYIVYKHTTPSNKVYIGVTCQKPEYRWNNGRGYNKNKHFSNAILKYGWSNIKHEILFDNLTEEEAKLTKRMYIAIYDSTNRDRGYNQSLGGEGSEGLEFTDEHKRKISQANKGIGGNLFTNEQKQKMRLLQKERMSDESYRKNVGDKLKGKNNPKAKAVICVDNGMVFETVSQASEYARVSHTVISRCCRGKQEKAGGFRWKYK